MKKRLISVFLASCVLCAGCGVSDDTPSEVNQASDSYVNEQEMTLDFDFGTRTGIYTGQIENGVPNGYGTFSSSNPSGDDWNYIGEWENGHFSGNGISEFEGGEKYIGEYSCDAMNGYGIYRFNDGEICIGEFKDGQYVPDDTYFSADNVPTPLLTAVPTDDTVASNDIYSDGTYIVGKTIPSGDYVVTSTRSSVNATVEINSDSLNKFSSLLFFEEFENFSYIHLNDGEYVSIENGTLSPWDGNSKSTLTSTSGINPGTYIVGVDIPSGEYELVSNGSTRSAYYILYNEIPSGKDGIFVSSDFYKNNGFLTVSDGQYLVFRNATLNFVK